ncbi:MAG: fasciclin domain-containing protein [Pseudomonadota bacterium]
MTFKKTVLGLATAVALAASSMSAQAADIVDTAAKNGNFTTLVKMIKAAGLVDTLKGKGPFTVFAPTDAAFKKWPEKELALFLNPAKKKHLVALLKLHVVPGKVMAADVAGKKVKAKTVEGGEITVDAMKAVMVNGSKVTQTDIVADNGIIHVIDTPLVPKQYRGSW